MMDTASGKVEKFDAEITNMGEFYNWSPDSQWIVTDIRDTGWGWRVRTVVVSVQTGRAFSVPAPVSNEMDHATWTSSWSPDGRSLLYSSIPIRTFDSSLKILDLKTEKITTLRDSLVQLDDLSWSPDNKQIAYFSIRPSSEGETEPDSLITLVNVQGDGSSHTSFSGKEPDWSPDGSQIAYVTTGLSGGAVAFYKVNGEQTTTVETGHEGINHYPRFSPDGELLAYVTSQGADADLWVYDSVTEDHFQLTLSGGFKRWLTWAPDGESIVFAYRPGESGSFDLWTVPAYGGKNRQITFNKEHDALPLWRHGTTGSIYYVSQRGMTWELWKTDLEGNEDYVLGSSGVNYPILINDPSHIYYGAGQSWWDDLNIFVSNAETKTEKQLTEGNARDPETSPDETKIAYADHEPDLWDQGVLWVADVGDLFPLKPIP